MIEIDRSHSWGLYICYVPYTFLFFQRQDKMLHAGLTIYAATSDDCCSADCDDTRNRYHRKMYEPSATSEPRQINSDGMERVSRRQQDNRGKVHALPHPAVWVREYEASERSDCKRNQEQDRNRTQASLPEGHYQEYPDSSKP